MFMFRPLRILLCLQVLLAFTANVDAQVRVSRIDPPGFGIVPLKSGQTIKLHVSCFDHQVGHLPPDPCRGTALLNDATGQTLVAQSFELTSGQSRSLQFTFTPIGDVNPGVDAIALAGIDPLWIPAAGGISIPFVEVFDQAGNPLLFENPAAARMTEFNNGFTNPGTIAGFNPQPDPPGFGLVTLTPAMFMRTNVACFGRPVNGIPPDPCRGTVMFHNAAGDVLKQADYDLKPGTVASFPFSINDRRENVEIIPCVLPQPGGRAVPNVELVNALTGDTMFLVNPAAARMSQFQQVPQ
jgi:hypothetical protein